MNNKELCKWLVDNSSGIYRPAKEAADRIKMLEEVLFNIASLPSSREDESHCLALSALKQCNSM
jgi:hypothetical protein